MILTAENYYSREADAAYMSCSQYQGFLKCEAMQVAKLAGRFVEKPSDALVVGNYVHTYLESPEAHQKFVNEHYDEIYKTRVLKDGTVKVNGKYAAFDVADAMIACVNSDATFTKFREMPHENEVSMTGEIFGVPWRIRMDWYSTNPRIILDWKTSANIRKLEYNSLTKQHETFIEAYGYMMRAAVYSEIEKQNSGASTNPMFLIAAVTKQDPPDKGLFSLNHADRYLYELNQVKEHLPRIMRVKEGAEKPRRCGVCDYCRATAKSVSIKPYYVLKPECWEGYETDDFSVEIVVDPSPEA